MNLFFVAHLKHLQFCKMSSSEVEETMKRLSSHKGVVGVLIINSEGIPVKSTLDNALAVQYAALISQLSQKAQMVVQDVDPQDELQFLRVRTKKYEWMIAPHADYCMIVIQNPSE